MSGPEEESPTQDGELVVEPAPPPGPARCGSCEAVLHGRFCSACGQEAHGSARSLSTLGHDVWHVFTHLDGRLWSTLRALLLRPGHLTAEYFRDRRVRYLPPFRVYLVLSVLFFALAALDAPDRAALDLDAADPAKAAAARQRLEAAAQELDASGQRPFAEALRGAADPSTKGFSAATCGGLAGVGGEWLGRALVAACERSAADGGRALGHAFLSNVPKTMFLFLPLVALVLFLLFGRSRRYYVEHLVLALHVQAALFLLFSIAFAFGALGARFEPLGGLSAAVLALTWGYATFYVFRSLRVVYGEGRFRTFAKFLALGLAYVVLLGVTLAGTALLSAVTA